MEPLPSCALANARADEFDDHFESNNYYGYVGFIKIPIIIQ